VLVPEVAAGAAGELAAFRSVCVEATRAVIERRPDRLIVVGGYDGADVVSFPDGTRGSLAGVGVDLTVSLGAGAVVDARSADLPLSLTLGAWLIRAAGWTGAADGLAVGVAPEAAADAVGAGKELRDSAMDVGLVVIGDGSARLTTASPGYVHPDAQQWQRDVDAAFSRGDAQYLLDLDPLRATELMASGRAPWQLAAASLGEAPLRVPVFATDDRYGVGYVAAAWIAE
jgi:hypothetical protein